jgi:hypothetical protein
MKPKQIMRPAAVWAEWFVPKDATDAYTKTVIAWIERIQNDAIAYHPESYVKRLHRLNEGLGNIRNKRTVFINGKSDHQETVKELKRIAAKALGEPKYVEN